MALTTAIIGGVAGLGSSIAKGVMAKKAGDRQAAELKKEAIELEVVTKERKRRVTREGRRFTGDQTAGIAAAGVEVSGSPLAALVETQTSVREENADIERNFRSDRQRLLTGAEESKRQGRQALAGGTVGGVAGAASSVAGLF